MPASVDEKLYGRLKAKDYARLLQEAKRGRLGWLEVEQEAVRRGSKLADLLAEHGMYWWAFYDLPFPAHLALFFHLFDWTQHVLEIGKSENPTKAFIEFMRERDDPGVELYAAMAPEKQALVINVLFGVFYSVEAMSYYSLSINELLAKARNGHPDAFKNAVSIDRAVIATETGGQLIADAQLRRNKAFLSGLFKRIKNPHIGRRQYVNLRLMHRIFEECGALATNRQEDILDLAQSLDLYTGRREDAVKGLGELFRNWKIESTS